MDQDELRDSIDELYAIQKQAGDRFIELTRENQWILEKLERKVFAHTDELVRYSKIYLGILVMANMLSILVLLWLFNSFNNGLEQKLEKLELMTKRSAYAALGIVGELEKLEKQSGAKKVSNAADIATNKGKKKNN